MNELELLRYLKDSNSFILRFDSEIYLKDIKVTHMGINQFSSLNVKVDTLSIYYSVYTQNLFLEGTVIQLAGMHYLIHLVESSYFQNTKNYYLLSLTLI